MEIMAQRHVSTDDSFHLPNFPHMAAIIVQKNEGKPNNFLGNIFQVNNYVLLF